MHTHKTLLSALLLAGVTMSLSIGFARADETKSNTKEKATPTTQQGGLLPGETRDQKRERLVKEIEKQVGPLSADQKTHILAVLAAAGDEMGAARANSSLTAKQQNEVVRRVHGDVFNRIRPALTPAQQSKLQSQRSGGGDFAGNSNLTPQERRARTMQRYSDALPDLTAQQKAEIEAVLDASSAKIKVAREDASLSEDARRQISRQAHTESATKIDALLTQAQRVKWAAAVAARRQAAQGGALPGESREEKRARLLKNYEAVITDLTVDQKTKILAIMEAAGDEMRAADGNTTLTDAQKKEEMHRVHGSVGGKVEAVLTADQLARWQKSKKARSASSNNA